MPCRTVLGAEADTQQPGACPKAVAPVFYRLVMPFNDDELLRAEAGDLRALGATLATLAQPHADTFAEGYGLLGMAMWTGTVLEDATKEVADQCVRAATGKPASKRQLKTWATASQTLFAHWPPGLDLPSNLEDRVSALRGFRNVHLAHRLPLPLWLALVGVGDPEGRQMNALSQFMLDALAVLSDLLAIPAKLHGVPTNELAAGGAGLIAALLVAGSDEDAVGELSPELDDDSLVRLLNLMPLVAERLAEEPDRAGG